jgi:hypothetical protein
MRRGRADRTRRNLCRRTRRARDRATICKIYNIAGAIGAETGEPFTGSLQQWTEQLVQTITGAGMNGFRVLAHRRLRHPMRRFAEEVAPAVGDALHR